MRILFITATRVGDAVLSTGLLSHLIGQYPEARCTIAAGPAALSLFAAVPNLEELIAMEKSGLERHWFDLWRRCIGTRWDIVVDLRRSAIVWMLFARKRYRVPKLDGAVHRVELLAATLGLRDDPPAPTLWTDERHDSAAKRLLPAGPPVLAIAPAANWRGKQWRADRFAELAVRLTGPDGLLPGARVAVFASEHEHRQAGPVLAALPEDRIIDTIGRIDLPTVAAALRRCALFIGNDSGLMHMAAAGNVPTLGLFGPSRDEHYAPWGRHTAVIRTPESFEELTGAPDYDHRTTGTLMDGLSIEQVETAAQNLWAQCGATA
jgi:ADP-heptose:LPS heptosyltransferase